MSFGWSASDILAGVQLANVLRKRYADAPGHLQALTNEFQALSATLQDAAVSWDEDELSDSKKLHLKLLTGNCNTILKNIDTTIQKYIDIGQPVPSTSKKIKQVWKRLTMEPDDIRELRLQAISSVVALNAFLSGLLKAEVIAVHKDTGALLTDTKALLSDTSKIRDDVMNIQQNTTALRVDSKLLEGYMRTIEGDAGLIKTSANGISSQVKEVLEQQESSRREELLEWVSPVRFGAQQGKNAEKRQPGTGAWFQNHQIYRNWINASGGTLFCSGMPGAGKTIMTSMVVDELTELQRSDPSIGMAHIYCDFGDQEAQTLSAMLSLILKQLLTSMPAIPLVLTEKYLRSRDSGRRLPVADILKYIELACQHFSTIFILVDALDECGNNEFQRDRLLSSLDMLRTWANINLFFTSRPVQEISSIFDGYPSIEIRAHDDDVESFLESAVRESSTIASRLGALQKEVIEVIRQAVQGMFLLAKLYIEAISAKRTTKDIKIELEKILTISSSSPGLQQSAHPYVYDYAYEQALERIRAQPAASQRIAERALSWIVCAKNKQVLNCELISRLLAIEDNSCEIEEDGSPSTEDVLSVCAGLVVLDRETSSFELVHYTAQEYFTREKSCLLPQPDLYLARSCMSYLTFDTVVRALGQTLPSEALKEEIRPWQDLMYDVWNADPIYQYAVLCWARHARDMHLSMQSLSKMFQNKLDMVIAFYLQLEHHTYEESRTRDLRLLNPLPMRIQRLGRMMADGLLPCVILSLCAYNGLLDIAAEIIHSKHDCQADNFLGFSPLYLAVVAQEEKMVELLLQEGCYLAGSVADDQQGSYEDLILEVHPLQAAAVGHSRRIVELLIAAGFVADIDILIWSAMSFGSEEVLKLFLEIWYSSLDSGIATSTMSDVLKTLQQNRDQITFPDEALLVTPFRYALQSTSQPRLEMISILVARGVELDAPDAWGSTALTIALGESRFDQRIVQLLLDSGANSNSPNMENQTPLHIAVENGLPITTVMALLQSKADPNIQDLHGNTPLHLAVDCANDTVAQSLIDAGASSQIKNYSHEESPFIRAARHNRVDLIKLMLAREDLDVKATDINGESALCFASAKQNTGCDLATLLLENGANPNQRSTDGGTPLLKAARCGNLNMVKLLAQNGANFWGRDANGNLAVEIAWESGCDDIVDFLDHEMSRTSPKIESTSPIKQAITWPYYLNYKTSFGRRDRMDRQPFSLFQTYESLDYMDCGRKLKLRQDFEAPLPR